MDQYKEEYRRHLPHIVPLHGTFHVTFRVKGSIPTAVIEKYAEEFEQQKSKLQTFLDTDSKKQKALGRLYWEYYEKFENELHKSSVVPLSDPIKARIVQDALNHFKHKRYELVCYSIMSNHVHVVLMNVRQNLSAIMKSIKGFTAYQINKIEEEKGTFWQDENYDHLIRSRNELADTIKYILNNPVKSSICNYYTEHKFTWCNERFLE